MEAPTTKQIRNWSNLDFAGYEYPEPAGEAEDRLDVIVARSADWLAYMTGRSFGPEASTPFPKELETTAGEAVQRRVEQLVIKSQEDEAETAGDIDMIVSFSAGSYSETRKDDQRATKFATKSLNPWPHLQSLLLMLMTEEKREYWEEVVSGVHRPYMSVTEVDWQVGDVLEDALGLPLNDGFTGLGA